MNRNEKRAMVAIKPETREKLMGIGRKGETYDYIINRLIEEYENNGKKYNSTTENLLDETSHRSLYCRGQQNKKITTKFINQE